MLIESALGKFSITAANSPDNVIVSSENQATIVSILDGVELMGGAENENPNFSPADINHTRPFGRDTFSITLSRAQLLRYFQYEIFNFLDYPSLTQMRSAQSPGQPRH